MYVVNICVALVTPLKMNITKEKKHKSFYNIFLFKNYKKNGNRHSRHSILRLCSRFHSGRDSGVQSDGRLSSTVEKGMALIYKFGCPDSDDWREKIQDI